MSKAPPIYYKQRWLEQQQQTLGQLTGRVDAVAQGDAPVTTPKIRSLAANCVMTAYAFSSNGSVPADPNRVYLLIQNQTGGAMQIFVAGGGPLVVQAFGYWEPYIAPTTALTISGTGVVIMGMQQPGK